MKTPTFMSEYRHTSSSNHREELTGKVEGSFVTPVAHAPPRVTWSQMTPQRAPNVLGEDPFGDVGSWTNPKSMRIPEQITEKGKNEEDGEEKGEGSEKGKTLGDDGDGDIAEVAGPKENDEERVDEMSEYDESQVEHSGEEENGIEECENRENGEESNRNDAGKNGLDTEPDSPKLSAEEEQVDE